MDPLGPESVEPLLRGRLGRPHRHLLRCDSTQLELGGADPAGALVTADEQTAGRGRLGRSWEAPAGSSLLASVVLRPSAFRRAAELSLFAGLAVAETIEAALGRQAAIKWPNDVLVDDRKLAGVLAEARAEAVVVGIGINVNQAAGALPSGTKLPAASLRTLDGRLHERAPLLAELLFRLERRYDEWLEHGLAAAHPELAARDALRGRSVLVDGQPARVLGVRPDGRLGLDSGPIESGDVVLV
ncbi:MAG: biotin--[acetyl-CoA-carboxylase] ligase [Gaiellaceae bacterium]